MREARAVVLGQGLSRRAGPAAAPPKPSLKLPDHAREKKFNACAPPDSRPPPPSSVFACSAHDHEPPVCPVAVHMHTTPRIIGPSKVWLSVIAHSCSGCSGILPAARRAASRCAEPASPLARWTGQHPSPHVRKLGVSSLTTTARRSIRSMPATGMLGELRHMHAQFEITQPREPDGCSEARRLWQSKLAI